MSKARKVLAGVVAVLAGAMLVIAIGLNVAPSMAPYEGMTYQGAEPASRGLRLRFFGVSTLVLSDGHDAVMIDGFFSRPGWLRLFFGKLEPEETCVEDALRKGGIGKLNAVLVAHPHHDHALDSAMVADKAKADLFGSASTLHIAHGQQLHEDRTELLWHGKVVPFGDFKVQALVTPHSTPALFPGAITEALKMPARVSRFKYDENYTFVLRHPLGTVLVVPGANFTPGLLKGVQAQVVLLGIGTLGKQPEAFIRRYWAETVRATGAKLVLPIHWDDFTRPLDEPLRPLPYLLDDMPRTLDLLQRLAEKDGAELWLPPLFEERYLPRAGTP